MAQIAGDDPQTEPPFHPIHPVRAAFAPAIIAPQARNATLDTRSPPIPAPEGSCAFQSLAFLGELARGRDRHPFDSYLLEFLFRLGTRNPTISHHQTRGPGKDLLVVGHGINGLP